METLPVLAFYGAIAVGILYLYVRRRMSRRP
jgi:hypothetical protein